MMILVLDERRQVLTPQESQVPKALKIQASGRVRTILSCLIKQHDKAPCNLWQIVLQHLSQI